jgi:hypothetical protein
MILRIILILFLTTFVVLCLRILAQVINKLKERQEIKYDKKTNK